jgi:uncharacterized OsmC-like protein
LRLLTRDKKGIRVQKTERQSLHPIDACGLSELAEKGKKNPDAAKVTLRATTVTDGQFRNLTYIRDLAPVVIDEPPQLLGQNTAPNPSESVLAALGACLAVGYMANATARGIVLDEIKVELEGDIDISPVWGLGNMNCARGGFSAVRVKAHLRADAPQETLAEIVAHATQWSPVAATLRNPVDVQAELV